MELVTNKSGKVSEVIAIDCREDGLFLTHRKHQERLELIRERYALCGMEHHSFLGRRCRIKKSSIAEFELLCMGLSRKGRLCKTLCIIGIESDPLISFDKSFENTVELLTLMKRYRPGMVVIQTRSPMVVLMMAVLQQFGSGLSVTVPFETFSQKAIDRFTPGLPSCKDRLTTANALRGCGIYVSFQCSPLLPYGDWRKDAGAFADTLVKHADHVMLKGAKPPGALKKKKYSPLIEHLYKSRSYHWLRDDSICPLVAEIAARKPKVLKHPEWKQLGTSQMDFEAA